MFNEASSSTPIAIRTAINAPIRSVAIIDFLDDFGIGGYIYELAEGLAANGISVDVYSSGSGNMSRLNIPRHHRLFPVLGSSLYKQRHLLRGTKPDELSSSAAPASISASAEGTRSPMNTQRLSIARRFKHRIRNFLLPIELAYYLKLKNYDVVWTQWPYTDESGTRFWAACKRLGIRLVHTVHNVLPHEETEKDRAICAAIYKYSDTLIVHSRYAAGKLIDIFPESGRKTILARHGMYTTYPRLQEARKRIRTSLNICEDQLAFLVFGGIRPYKNTDAVLQAFSRVESSKAVLIVAGHESGYPDLVPGQPLGRTQRIAKELGIADRVRFIPGLHEIEQTSEVFEAADVMVLPYLESYGSGALLLGMTFGKYILATPAGGMEEYLEEYPLHTLLEGAGVDEILSGIETVIESYSVSRPMPDRISAFEWKTIARQVIAELNGNEIA
jgi:glycosyltransferase involved in cell wall biosynthesis